MTPDIPQPEKQEGERELVDVLWYGHCHNASSFDEIDEGAKRQWFKLAEAVLVAGYVPAREHEDDDDNAGAELSRMEDDMLDIHDVLTDAGLPGAVNAESIRERIVELAKAREITDRQRHEITTMNAVLHRKNVELDALHMVWCDGGCPRGVHRWSDELVTEEIVAAAERNATRLRRWFDAACFRLDGALTPTASEWHREYVATITLTEVLEWLRGDEGERVRREADEHGVPAEDALAHALEAALGQEEHDG